MSGMLIGIHFFRNSNGCGALLNKYFYHHEDSLQNLSIPDKNKDIGQDLGYYVATGICQAYMRVGDLDIFGQGY